MFMNAQIKVPSRSSAAFRSPLNRLAACTLLAAGLFVVSSAFAPKAHADGLTCTVTAVWYDQASNNSPRLQLFCAESSTPFVSFVTNTDTHCSSSNKTIDTLKVWASLASANQLAGHKIFIDFNPIGTCSFQTINNARSG
jgi:hypothetical protein